MVERATLDDERTVTGTLDTIVDRARRVGVEPPAITVVGEVVDVRETVAHCLGNGAAGEWGPAPSAAGPVEEEIEVNQQ
jgi:uroporphyrin-III C-methyltransferase